MCSEGIGEEPVLRAAAPKRTPNGPASDVGSTRAYVRVRSFLVIVGPEIGGYLRSRSSAASPLCTGRSAGGQLEVGFVPESMTAHDPLRLDRDAAPQHHAEED